MQRVCFVCLGNICRSPTAEAVMRSLVAEAGLDRVLEIESAGTEGWHEGKLPDPRTRIAGAARGYAFTHRARRFRREDFARFDSVIAMDRDNAAVLRALARSEEDRSKIQLLRAFEPGGGGGDVPDPYGEGPHAFEGVLDVCEASCRGLLDHLRREHGW